MITMSDHVATALVSCSRHSPTAISDCTISAGMPGSSIDNSTEPENEMNPLLSCSRVVRWKDEHPGGMLSSANNKTPSIMVEGHQGKISPTDFSAQEKSSASLAKKQGLRRRIERVGSKIHKAARIELAYLNKAAKLRDQRCRWTELYKVVACKDLHVKLKARVIDDTSPISLRELQNVIIRVKDKVREIKRVEKSLLAKSREIRDKRCEWTTLYERANERLKQARMLKRSNAADIHVLPPLPVTSSSKMLLME